MVVGPASSAGVAGANENRLRTCLQELLAVSNSMSSWNNLPLKMEHDETAAAADGDDDAHKSTRTMRVELAVPIWKEQNPKR